MNIKKIFFFTIFFIILFLYIATFLFNTYFSIYGIILFSFLISQLLFSIQNLKQMKKLNNDINNVKTNILIIGYREDPIYWKNCLESIRIQNFKNINKILISIDGDEQEDIYMYDDAKKILTDSHILLNKHKGKRSAIIHGYKYLQEYYPSDYIILIDSDTILEKNACNYLIQCIDSDSTIGCVTSNIKIFNCVNLLTKIINARYSYAFNIERSYLSYLNIMNCCSGPLSIYRSNLITDDFLEKFQNQSISGYSIEPGDDRHQTLLIMSKGYKSKMTPLSICWTESPTTLKRFLRQQLRWMRSFYREQYWQYKCLENQPFSLSFIMTYEILFPYLIIGWVLYIFYNVNISIFLIFKSFILTTMIALIRTIFITFYTKDIKNIYNIFYLYIYFIFLIPLKFLAFFTILDNKWITSNRLNVKNYFSFDIFLMYFIIFIWNFILLFGFIIKLN